MKFIKMERKNFKIIWLFGLLLAILVISGCIGNNESSEAPTAYYEFLLELDWTGVDESDRDVSLVKSILEERLNTFGLEYISVRSGDGEHIKIQIDTKATPLEQYQFEKLLESQARFEERIDGALAVKGDEISIELGARGSRIEKTATGVKWAVVVNHNEEGACRFGEVATGKKGRPVDIFIDRPENTIILISKDTYDLLNKFTSLTLSDGGDIMLGDSAIEVIEKRADIPVVVVDINATYTKELEKYIEKGIVNVIIAGNEREISEDIRNKLEENGFKTERIEQKEYESYGDWITRLIGLENTPTLQFDPRGKCQYNVEISKSARSVEEAKDEIKRVQALLGSGNLPAKPKLIQLLLCRQEHELNCTNIKNYY